MLHQKKSATNELERKRRSHKFRYLRWKKTAGAFAKKITGQIEWRKR